MTSKFDIYEEVTAQIVAALEQGVTPWIRPWKNGAPQDTPHNAVSGREYNGINLFLLSLSPYQSQGWLTYKQATELGGNVRKGERGTTIVFWQFVKKEEDGKVKTIPFAKAYRVFNVEQCENLDESKVKVAEPAVVGKTSANELAERVGAFVAHGGNKAFYSYTTDRIGIPSFEHFESEDGYNATLAHELVHWTGHRSRCNRQFGARFGDNAYAFEELVAEIGAAFTCAKLGIELKRLRHESYISAWLDVLKQDKRAIFTAASKAKEATEFLFSDREEEHAKKAA